MVKILAFPGARNATRTEGDNPSPDTGGGPLLTTTSEGTVVISARAHPDGTAGGWTNQELADLYRVEALLVQANIRISTDRGLTDEGDPWFVFCKEGGEIFVHLARIDGSYLLDSPGLGEILHGSAFAVLIERFIQIATAKATQNSNIVTLRPKTTRDSVVRLHPAVMLAALVWSLYLASSKFGGVAHAADGLAPRDTDATHGHHEDLAAAHADPHNETVPSQADVALAHLVEHLPKPKDGPAAGLPLPSGRVVTATTAVSADPGQTGFDLRGAMTAATLAFASQGVAASLTVIALSYGFYVPSREEQFHQDADGKSAALPVQDDRPQAADVHINPTVEAQAEALLNKEQPPTDVHDAKPAEATDPRAAFPVLRSDAANEMQHVADSSSSSGTQPVVAAAQAATSDLPLPRADSNNPGIVKRGDTADKALAAQPAAGSHATSETQGVLGLISHYIGNAEVYKVGGLTVSATFNINDINKVLGHLGDPSTSTSVSGSSTSETGIAAIGHSAAGTNVTTDPASATDTAPAADSTSSASDAPAALSPYAHYDASAQQFVTQFLQETGTSLQMMQFNSEIVLVDMSALDDPNDQTATRSWVTDDGHIISTVGHLQDFVAHGMV